MFRWPVSLSVDGKPENAGPEPGDTVQVQGNGPPARGKTWLLLCDVLAFQVKLAADGVRDVLLSPVAIIAALAGVLTQRQGPPDRYFRSLLRFGRRTDHWINLFGSTSRERGKASNRPIDAAAIAISEELAAHLNRKEQAAGRRKVRTGRRPPESDPGQPGPHPPGVPRYK